MLKIKYRLHGERVYDVDFVREDHFVFYHDATGEPNYKNDDFPDYFYFCGKLRSPGTSPRPPSWLVLPPAWSLPLALGWSAPPSLSWRGRWTASCPRRGSRCGQGRKSPLNEKYIHIVESVLGWLIFPMKFISFESLKLMLFWKFLNSNASNQWPVCTKDCFCL